MDLYNLQAKIGINTKEFSAGIATAGKEFSELGGKIKSGAETIAKVGVAAFTALTGAATATTAAILKGVDAYTTYGDNVDKMSQKLNMSAQAYQEWSAIMEHSGTSIDSMQASMKTLANAVESGNDAFERLGITQEEIASLNNEQLFSRTITALQNVGNETERTYLAGQLLGRGATELGALLNTSAEDTEKMRQRVHELGGVMSDEAVKASAKYKDSIQDMKTAFKGIGRGLIQDFVPALTQVSDGLTAIFSGDEKGAEMFMKGFDEALANLGKSASKLKPIVKKMVSVAAEVVPQIIGTVAEGVLNSAPAMLEAGKNALKNIAEGMENADLNFNNNVLSKLLGAVVDNIPEYLKYAQTILSNLANSLLNIDYGKVASSISTVITSAINSISDFLANVDMHKVGQNIGDFVKNIDWKGIAESVIDLLGSAIGSLGDIAAGFFENMDGATLFTAIGVLGAPKLLGGLNQFMGSTEGQALGKTAGGSWSSAFMAGIEAFGLGWAIGTYLRDNIKIGDKTLGEWVDQSYENVMEGKKSDGSYSNTVWGAANALHDKWAAEAEAEDTFTYQKNGQTVTGYKYDIHGNETEAYKAYQRAQKWTNVDVKETFKYYANGGLQSAYKYDSFGNLSEAWKKYGGQAFAEGGRVTRPTIALVGEKEPETIIPDSKRGEFGTTNYNTFNISIDGTGKNAEEIADEAIEVISTKLDILGIQQQRAVGGKSWA